jgi:hypothetical protein
VGVGTYEGFVIPTIVHATVVENSAQAISMEDKNNFIGYILFQKIPLRFEADKLVV